MFAVDGFAFGVNYGYDKVRFPAPLPVDSQVRMRATLASVDDVPGGVQITVTQTFEREGGEKPVCVAESLVRLYTAAARPSRARCRPRAPASSAWGRFVTGGRGRRPGAARTSSGRAQRRQRHTPGTLVGFVRANAATIDIADVNAPTATGDAPRAGAQPAPVAALDDRCFRRPSPRKAIGETRGAASPSATRTDGPTACPYTTRYTPGPGTATE